MALAISRTDDELKADVDKVVTALAADGIENITPKLVAAELGCAPDYTPSDRLIEATKKAVAGLKKAKKAKKAD